MKAPRIREAAARLGGPGPRRRLVPRGVPGSRPLPGSRRPRSLRRRGPRPGRRIPARKIAGGLQFRPPARPQTGHHRAPGHRRIPHRSVQRGPARPTRNRQNPPRDRVRLRAAQLGHRVLFATATDWVARLQAAHQAGRLAAGAASGCAATGCSSSTRSATSRSSRTPRTCSSSSSLTLRTRLADPHLEPALRPLGRRVRRPGRRLSHDRPHRPPRRRHHPQRLQLPAQTCTDGLFALDKTGKSGRITNVNVAHFSTRELAHFSTSADILGNIRNPAQSGPSTTRSEAQRVYFVHTPNWPSQSIAATSRTHAGVRLFCILRQDPSGTVSPSIRLFLPRRTERFVPRMVVDPAVGLFRADEWVFTAMLDGWQATDARSRAEDACHLPAE